MSKALSLPGRREADELRASLLRRSDASGLRRALAPFRAKQLKSGTEDLVADEFRRAKSLQQEPFRQRMDDADHDFGPEWQRAVPHHAPQPGRAGIVAFCRFFSRLP